MTLCTHVPEDEYLRKIGLVAYLVSSLEALLLFDLPLFETALPPQLGREALTGKTTIQIASRLAEYGPSCTDRQIGLYLIAGGQALLEVAPQCSALLHPRPANEQNGLTRPFRRRLPEAQFIDVAWLDRLVKRLDVLHVEVDALRPPLTHNRDQIEGW